MYTMSVHSHDHAHESAGVHVACPEDASHSHTHDHAAAQSHAIPAIAHNHAHEHYADAGTYEARDKPRKRKFGERAFVVGVGGPVGSGKTALMLQLCLRLREKYNLAAVTNDIFTREDGEFLTKHGALSADRIRAVETGGCPHAAIREDITANLLACEELTRQHACTLILLESGGDNLAADYSRELADFTIYVIDTAGGDKVPRKGGPGITQSDLLVVNKIDLAEAVGASIAVMNRDAKLMRGAGPTVFAQVKHGVGMEVCSLPMLIFFMISCLAKC